MSDLLGYFRCDECDKEWQRRGINRPDELHVCHDCDIEVQPYRVVCLSCDEEYNDCPCSEYPDEENYDDEEEESDEYAGVYRWYGYFSCPKCNRGWESSQVYKNFNREFFKQSCKKCRRVFVKPYYAEPITCHRCGKWGKYCKCKKGKRKDRHVDDKKPHLSDLCIKCIRGNPCHR